MPTVQRFATCKIAVYADDHMPPHFHIEGRGFRVIVEIETLAVRAGSTRRAGQAMAGRATISSCYAMNGYDSIDGYEHG
jgi:hypothetical protein